MKVRILRVPIFFLAFLLFSSFSNVYAEESLTEVTLYGPEAFVRNSGSPQTEARDFSVQRFGESYLLKVQNGSVDGDNQVSSAVITLNGTTILKQNDFNQNVYSLEKPVTLQTANHLEVKLNSIPSAYITLTIVGYYLPEDVDDDGDGYTENEGDCNDADSAIFPGAAEVCDGIDNNCDVRIDEGFDQDADGYTSCGGDCDDTNADTYTGAPELCDGLDNDCDSVVPANEADGDLDTFRICDNDCNDTDPAVNPNAAETCDGIDNNCDGRIDEGCLTAIMVAPDAFTLTGLGATQQLTVTGYYAEGTTADLTASSTGTSYASDNTAVATVDAEGLVTATGNGTAVITAQNSGFSHNATVTVSVVVNDVIPPQITIGSPTNKEIFYAGTVDVTGTVNEPVQSVTVNGIPATIGTQTFTASGISLTQCENTITVEATDLAGNTGTRSITVYNYTLPPEVTEESGYIVGYVLEYGTETPIQAARITVEGICGSLLTDADGRYVFPLQHFNSYSPTKYFDLKAEKDGYTHVNFQAQGMIGKEMPAEPVHLTSIDTQVTTITPSLGGTAVNSLGDTEVVIPPGAVDSDIDVTITMYDTEEQLPAPLKGRELYAIGEFEPQGTVFNVPVTVRLPNRYNMPAGTLIPCVDYDPETKVWNDVGDGVVSADERFIDLEVQHFSWYGATWVPDKVDDDPTNATTTDDEISNQTCESEDPNQQEQDCGNSSVSLKKGTLRFDYSLTSYKSMGKDHSLDLHYDSGTAYPQTSVSFSINTTRTPKRTRAHLTAFGMQTTEYFGSDNGKFTWVTEAKDALGNFVPTGIYPYSMTLTNTYDIIRHTQVTPGNWVDSTIEKGYTNSQGGSFFVNNQTESPLGAGWSLRGISRLIKNRTLDITILDGNGKSHQFEPKEDWIDTIAGGGIGDGNPAPQGSLNSPRGMAMDSSGNLYIADQYHRRIRKVDPSGFITTIAGNGSNASSGDGGPALQASFGEPYDVAIDDLGNLYIADKGTNVIRKIDTRGIITTVAGQDDGWGHYGGDGGLATSANLCSPSGVAVDHSGNLYIADQCNNRIRRVDPSGRITTFAGNGNRSPSPTGDIGDGGPAKDATMYGPYDVAVDAAGNVYFSDFWNYRIRKVDTNGIISTVAGNGSTAYNGDNIPAINAGLNRPSGIDLDASGNLYIADQSNQRIRKVDPSGIITTIAGMGNATYGGDGGLATSASLHDPAGVLVDFSGEIYIADTANQRIRKIDHSGIVDTVAGTGSSNFSGDGGPALSATLSFSFRGVAADSFGNIYIADTYNNRIRKVDPSGVITTIAGNGRRGSGGDGGPAVDANLNQPEGVAVDSAGNVFIADTRNNTIRKVGTDGIIRRIAGIPGRIYTVCSSNTDGVSALNIDMASPEDVAVDASGNVYIADAFCHKVLKVDPSGMVTTFAGDGTSAYSGDGGPAVNASIKLPSALAIDKFGNLFIADESAHCVRMVDVNGIITTVAGDGTYGFSGDGGPAAKAQLYSPEGIAVDQSGDLYISQAFPYQRIRKVDPYGIIDTIAGTGGTGFSGDGVPAKSAVLNYPYGLATDDAGNLYVAEGANQRVRILSPYLALKYADSLQMVSKDGESTLNLMPDGTAEWVLKDGTKKYFDANGLQTSTVDRNGNTTTYAYDGSGNLTSITDPTGLVTTLSYSSGKLGSITTPDGRVTIFAHDANGDLTSITEPDGSVTQYQYDNRHLVTAKIRPGGQTTQYNYDAHGRIANVVAPTGETRTYAPADAVGLINDIPAGTGTKETPAANIPAAPSTKTDGMGYIHSYDTDARGATLAYTDPLGNVTQYDRDTQSRPTRIIRPDGTEVTMTYDGLGNLLTTTNVATGATTTMTYNSFSQVTSITDPLGNVTNMTYDTNGNLTDITDALGNRTTFTYDINGLVTSMTDALGNVTSYTYDTNGNLASVADPLGKTTTYTRDSAGNILTRTDANGNTTTYTYDSRNRITSVTDAQGSTTTYTYAPSCGCSSGGGTKLASITDANGGTTSFTYNEIGQLISETDPMGRITTYTYDANRQLATRTDPNGNTIVYTYDELNRLIRKQMPGDTSAFSYDVVGRMLSAQDGDSSLSFTYDTAGRLTDVVNSLGAVSYSYDLNGNRITMTDAEGGITDYVCDALNRITEITNPSAETSTFTYDALSRRTGITLPNGGTTSFSYDATSRLLDLINQVNSTNLSNFTYTYDNIGNRLTLTDKDGLHNYTYDQIYRLLSATHPQPENPAENFSYDPVGNRLSDSSYSDHTYNANNQLTSYDSVTYTYDHNGNTISKTDTTGTTYYTYDPENKLTRIDFPDGTYAEYKYDPFGRRIQKNVNGTVTKYLYDGEDILAEYDAANTRTARYTHGPGIDEPLIMERGGSSYYYHADGLGSITEITDSTGNIVNEYVYNSFGKVVKETEGVNNPYTYTSRIRDKESGFYFYRARFYNPEIGRFFSVDPLGLAGGINLYAYVANNPVKYRDPWGLDGALVPEPSGPSGPTQSPSYPKNPVYDVIMGDSDDYYYPSDFSGDSQCVAGCFDEANKTYDLYKPIPLFEDPSAINEIGAWDKGREKLIKCVDENCSEIEPAVDENDTGSSSECNK